jgi:hypothetical protein
MKSLNTKLVLSVLGIAALATPAFAQRPYWQARPYNNGYQAAAAYPGGLYPNPVASSDSAQSIESGAEFNTIY